MFETVYRAKYSNIIFTSWDFIVTFPYEWARANTLWKDPQAFENDTRLTNKGKMVCRLVLSVAEISVTFVNSVPYNAILDRNWWIRMFNAASKPRVKKKRSPDAPFRSTLSYRNYCSRYTSLYNLIISFIECYQDWYSVAVECKSWKKYSA